MNLEYIKERFKEFIPIMICILYLFILMVIYNGISKNALKAVSVKQNDVTQLENQLALAKNRMDTKKTEFTIKNTGVDENRLHRDEGIISDFLTKVGTWDSYTFGLNIKFTGNTTYLLSTSEDYSYLSEAYMESRDDEGGEGRTRMVLLFSITPNGKLSSVYGTSVAG